MKRRELITLLGGAAAAWPLAARGQQPAMPLIGLLNSESADAYSYLVAAFWRGLNETGYEDGRNVVIEYRWADGVYDRLPGLAADLVLRPTSVIAALGAPATGSAKSATATIPIVFLTAEDAVEAGLVASFSRPGGNMTGVSLINVALTAKRMELLREITFNAPVMGILINTKNPIAAAVEKELQEAANAMGQRILPLYASTAAELQQVFATLVELRAGALLIAPDPFFIRDCARLAALAARHTIPAIHAVREFTSVGGLMSYGPNLADEWRKVGVYTGRILKGDKPANLPVIRPTKFELVINLKTAKAFGLTVPLSLLARADEVIE
jgi:putative ABC transport system substrate-binding protein